MPRKVFVNGNVLTDTDLNTFLMNQTVMTFAGTAARSSAIGTAIEGMVTYLEDSNTITVWDGAVWQPVYPPTIPAITAVAGSVVVFGSTAVSTAYTAVSGLDNGTIIVTGTAAVTVTVPDILAVGDSLNIIRDSSGTVTIAAGTGVTNWAGAGTSGTAVTFKIDQQFNGAQILKTAANTYRVIGKIIP